MTSTRLESASQVLKEGVWDITITLPTKIKAPVVVLNIESLDPTGFIGSISIDDVPYPLDLHMIKGDLILFRPRDEFFNSLDPLLYLFAGSVTEGTGTVIIYSLVNPNDDLGLEGSWTATTKPTDPGE